jgi:phosphatidylglycerophosphate synthase
MQRRPAKRPTPTPWWAEIVLYFLGVTSCLLTVAYISWVQVEGRIYWLGVFMIALNLALTVAAVVASRFDSRTGRVSWRLLAALFGLVLAGVLLFPAMGRWAP